MLEIQYLLINYMYKRYGGDVMNKKRKSAVDDNGERLQALKHDYGPVEPLFTAACKVIKMAVICNTLLAANLFSLIDHLYARFVDNIELSSLVIRQYIPYNMLQCCRIFQNENRQ